MDTPPDQPNLPNQPTGPADVDGTPVAGQRQASGRPKPTNETGKCPYDLDVLLAAEWGRDGNIGYNVKTRMVDWGRKAGWDKLKYAIEQAAHHGKKIPRYVEVILFGKKQDELKGASRSLCFRCPDCKSEFPSVTAIFTHWDDFPDHKPKDDVLKAPYRGETLPIGDLIERVSRR